MNCTQYTPNGHQNATPAVARSRYRYTQTEFPVLADRSLTATDIRIYSILKLHRNAKTGHAWPSRATIASIANCTPDHVTKATRRLERAGYLIRTLKSGQSNLYTFPLADGFEIKPQPANPPSVNQASPIVPVVVEIPPAVVVEASPVVPVVVEIPPPVVVEARPAVPVVVEIPPAVVVEASPTVPVVVEIPPAVVVEASPTVPVVVEIPPAVVVEARPTVPVVVEPPPLTVSTSTTRQNTTEPRLSWPAWITLAIQQFILKVLAGLTPADMQSIVDEMAGVSERTTIANPVGYARKLAQLQREG